MKNLLFIGAVTLLVIAILMAIVNNAFAQTPQSKQHVVRVSGQEGNDTEMVLSAPGPGENLTVIVDVPVRTRKVTPPKVTNIITNVQNVSSLRLRGGVNTGVLLTSPAEMTHADMTALVGLVGEIGYSDSPWRLRSRFSLGKCQDGNTAVGGDLAALRRLSGGLFAGVGADLLYCADTKARPRELGKKRLVGGSMRFAYEEEYRYSSVIVELSLGLDAETAPVPGGRKHSWLGAAGLSVSYLF